MILAEWPIGKFLLAIGMTVRYTLGMIDGAVGSDIDRKEIILGNLRSRYRHRFDYYSDRPNAAAAVHHGRAGRQDCRLPCLLHPADRRDGLGRFDSFRELDVNAVLLVLPRHGGPRPEPLYR